MGEKSDTYLVLFTLFMNTLFFLRLGCGVLSRLSGRIALCIGIIILSILSSCASSVRFSSERKPFYYPASPPSVSSRTRLQSRTDSHLQPAQKSLLRAAEVWLGTPYCYGGVSAQCVDCSGFVQNVFQTIDLQLPRTSQEMYAKGKRTPAEDIEIGDLVFFDFENDGSVGHVGMYVGEGEIIHASTSRGVIIQSLDDEYLRRHIKGYRRWLSLR